MSQSRHFRDILETFWRHFGDNLETFGDVLETFRDIWRHFTGWLAILGAPLYNIDIYKYISICIYANNLATFLVQF